jgi:hypothetical protein
MNFIDSHSDKPWDWSAISLKTNIETLKSYPNKPWVWSSLSKNPNITMEFIEANLNKSWNWYEMSLNPNLTIEFIEAHPNKPWDWDYISHNYFIYDDIVCEQQMKKDIKIKHDAITSNTSVVPDLAEIVAAYCGYL